MPYLQVSTRDVAVVKEVVTDAGQEVLNVVSALVNGATKAYLTYAELEAAKTTLPTNSFARVTNDPDPVNNWLWQWDGTTLTKSDRDDLAVALAAVDDEEVARIAADTAVSTALWALVWRLCVVLSVPVLTLQRTFAASPLAELVSELTLQNGFTVRGEAGTWVSIGNL